MKFGLHIPDFTWEGGPTVLGERLAEVARLAEQGGFDRISVMDHVWQIGPIGPPEHDMLEAYTTLGYLAGNTERVSLLTMVTAVVYREPGLLAKVRHHPRRALRWPGHARYRRGVERGGVPRARAVLPVHRGALRTARGGAADLPADVERDDGPYDGRHYRLARTLNSPQSLSRPHPPILIGGGGERKTLRLVAQLCRCVQPLRHARAGPQARGACASTATGGRDYAEIEKTVQVRFNLGANGEHVERDHRAPARAARSSACRSHTAVSPTLVRCRPLELMAERIIPAVAEL